MLDTQTKKMTDALNEIDFRHVFDKVTSSTNGYLSIDVDRYLHMPLINFLERVLKIKKKRDDNNETQIEFHKKIKLISAISILCNIKKNSLHHDANSNRSCYVCLRIT